MARILQVGFELQTTLEYTASNASVTPTITFPTPGRSGITGTCSRRAEGNGFGSGYFYLRKAFAAAAEIYSQHAYAANGSGGSGGKVWGWRYFDASLNNVLSILCDPSNGTLTVTAGNSTVLGTLSATFSSAWTLVEVHLKIDASVGEIDIKFDGVNVFSFAGDTDPNSRVSAAYMQIDGGSINGNWYADDWIVNDTTGGEQDSWVNNETLLLGTLNGNGDSSDLTGSDGDSTNNYLNVDDVPHNSDTDYNAAASSGLKDLYTMSNLPTLPAGSTIKVFQPVAVCRRADPATPSNVDIGLKSGTTEDFAASQALTTSYALLVGDVYYADPDDAAAWDETKINALQIGVESS